MKLIVWLWNPGKEYSETRHNLGFLFLEYLKEKEKFSDFKDESKFKWEVSSGIIKWDKTLLLKPSTYMNLSWESLRKIVDFYKIEIDDIIVIYDDISMDFWKIRIRDSWSAGWHNWVKSIINHFWNEWNRVKVGIWLNTNFEVSDWVLSKFTKDEIEKLENKVFREIYELMKEKI